MTTGRRAAILAGASLAFLAAYFNTAAVNVALAALQRQFAFDVAGLQWFINAYALTLGLLLISGGRAADLVGRRRVFLAGAAITIVASLGAALAPSAELLIAARVVQAVGTAACLPAGLALIAEAYGPADRGKAFGVWGALTALGTAAGPIAGGVLTERLGWEWIFIATVVLLALATALIWIAAPESRDERARAIPDAPGLLTLTISSLALVVLLHDVPDSNTSTLAAIALLAAAVLGFSAFRAVEARRTNPLIDFRALASRTFVGANVASFVFYFVYLGVVFFEALFLLNALDVSPVDTGLSLLPLTVTMSVISVAAGWLVDRVGARAPVVTGMGLLIVSLLMQSELTERSAAVDVVFPLFVMGIGVALVMSPASHAAVSAVAASRAATASGIVTMTRQMGGVFGVAMFGAVFSLIVRHAEMSDGLDAARNRPELDGLISGSAGARERLRELSPSTAEALITESKRVFAEGLAGAMRVGALVALVGLVAAVVLMRDAPRGARRAVADAES